VPNFSEAVSVAGLFHGSKTWTTREGAKNNSRFLKWDFLEVWHYIEQAVK
jgi:hypothetical protein